MSEPTAAARVRGRLGRMAVAIVLVGAAVAAGRAVSGPPADLTIDGTARGAVALTSSAAAALPPVIEGPDRPGELVVPHTEAGVRRVWWARGTWWALLPDPTSGTHHIWGLSGPDGPWVDTGTFVDERLDAQLEVGWDGEDVVVAATGSRLYRRHALRIHRYSWSADAAAWVSAPDHPLQATDVGEPGARVALAADGSAWVVRRREGSLEVGRTAGRAARWAGWSSLPLGEAGGDVGSFDLVRAGDDVAVVVRRASVDALLVARHRADGTWDLTDVPVADVAGQEPVDVEAAEGALLVLAPTSVRQEAAGDQAPALLLVEVPAGGATAPRVSVVSRAGDGLQHAALVVDAARARVVAVAPPSPDETRAWGARRRPAPTALVLKEASLDDLVFAPGAGGRLMSGIDGADLSRPLLPVAVDPASGVVAIATADGASRWATWASGVAPAAEAPRPAAPGTETVLVDDTFDTQPVGGPGPTSWAPEDSVPPAGVVVADPTSPSERALRLEGGPDPVSVCRPIPVVAATTLVVRAVLQAEGQGTQDARLLTLRGSGGSVASVRQSRQGLVGWSTGEGRVTSGAAPDGVPLDVTVRLDLVARTAAVTVTAEGRVIADGEGIPWLTASDQVDELCVRAAPGPDTSVRIGAVRVTGTQG